MPPTFSRQFSVLVCALFTLTTAVRADKPIWAGTGGGGSGGASSGGNWTTGTKPGKTDKAVVATGKATVDSNLEFGALEFTGGTIDGAFTLTLSLTTDVTTWTFTTRSLVVVRKAQQLQREFELDTHAVTVVLRYLDRIEALEAQIRSLRAQMR